MYTGIIPLYIVPSLTWWRVPGINLSGVLLSCLEYTTIPFSNYACAIDSALCKTPYSWNWFLNQIFPSFSWQSYTIKNPNALLTPLTARADARTSFSYLPAVYLYTFIQEYIVNKNSLAQKLFRFGRGYLHPNKPRSARMLAKLWYGYDIISINWWIDFTTRVQIMKSKMYRPLSFFQLDTTMEVVAKRSAYIWWKLVSLK